ncbi:MAG: hypothetical protein HOO96_01090 [Polyangiaceae bacterium]|nr:hypothetical protein [Polyangiaceae bacterium]
MHRALYALGSAVAFTVATAACGIQLTGGKSSATSDGGSGGNEAGAGDDAGPGDKATLNVTLTQPAAQVELEKEGILGWIHWGDGDDAKAFDEKSSAPGVIPSFEVTGAKDVVTLHDNFTTFRWTNGTPNETDTANRTAVYALGQTPAFALQRKVDTPRFHLVVYAGVFRAQGLLRATMVAPDGASVSAEATLENKEKNGYGRFDIAATGAVLGAKLDVRWEMVGAADPDSNITLAAATLAP